MSGSDRKGLHESISGEPAEATLNDLVSQFSDRYAFIRELIQNSLDAGAADIEVVMTADNAELEVAVVDDGEGMDRDTIEGYLLTLFRSTKEDDLTKIGKFGIGFVSLFAMNPYETVVDTGRDGIWHRVVFAQDRSWTLMKMDDPFEGTTVTLRIKRIRPEAAQDCERIHRSAQTWCRFARAEITTTARGIEEPWTDRSVAAPFTVDSPVSVSGSGDGWRAVVGISAERNPRVGFFNQGLTLWEAETPILPGVTFKVEGRHLEHTLTRDNVRRDRHFDWILDRVRELATGPLADAVHAEMVRTINDETGAHVLFSSLPHRAAFAFRDDVPWVPMVGGAPATLAMLRPQQSWLSGLVSPVPLASLTTALPESRLGRAVAAAGTRVVGGHPTDARVRWLASHLGTDEPVTVTRVDEIWFQAKQSEDPAVAAAVAAAQQICDAKHPWSLYAGDFSEGGQRLVDRLAIRQPVAFALERDGDPHGVDVMVNAHHPAVVAVSALPAEHAGPLLLRAVLVDLGVAGAPLHWLRPDEVAS